MLDQNENKTSARKFLPDSGASNIDQIDTRYNAYYFLSNRILPNSCSNWFMDGPIMEKLGCTFIACLHTTTWKSFHAVILVYLPFTK